MQIHNGFIVIVIIIKNINVFKLSIFISNMAHTTPIKQKLFGVPIIF